MSVDPFTDGDATIGHHAATCGTNPTHSGHCTTTPACECWCHYSPVIVVIQHQQDTTR